MEDFGDSEAADAAILAAAQAVEHYEIVRYGTLKTWAEELGLQDAVKLIDQNLQEEDRRRPDPAGRSCINVGSEPLTVECRNLRFRRPLSRLI